MNLHCIGDSHCSFFLGYDNIPGEYPVVAESLLQNIYCYRLGASLAYNANKYGTSTKSKEKIDEIVAKLNPASDILLLSFGEIDCRAHILKQSEIKNVSFEQVVNECVSNYWSLINQLHQLGFKIIVWNAVYSANYEEQNKDLEYPYFGKVEQRNSVTQFYNVQLKNILEKHDIPFLDISQNLIDPHSKLTNSNYYFDSVHLNNKLFLITINNINSFFQIPVFTKKQIVVYRLKLWQMNFSNNLSNVFSISKKRLKSVSYGKKI